ncbi:MAG: hypothetical protein H0V17_09460, partial [Deltaproteobacteria bacterium]|nr:hypothetical protein [Deltaproteobacteria bacterium]
LGRDLSARVQLVAEARLVWSDGALQLGSPRCTEVIASDEIAFVAIASQVALPCSVAEALAALSELPPAMVIETLDALVSAKLLIPAAPIQESRTSIAIERPTPDHALAPLLAHAVPRHLQLIPLREGGVTTIYISARLEAAEALPLATIAADAETLASALLEAARGLKLAAARVAATLPLAVWPEPIFAAIAVG